MDVGSTLIGCTKCKEREEIIEELLAIIFEKNEELGSAKEEISRLKKQMNIADPPNRVIAKPLSSDLIQPVIFGPLQPVVSEIAVQQPHSSAKIDLQNRQPSLSSELKRRHLGVDTGEPITKIGTGKFRSFDFPTHFFNFSIHLIP